MKYLYFALCVVFVGLVAVGFRPPESDAFPGTQMCLVEEIIKPPSGWSYSCYTYSSTSPYETRVSKQVGNCKGAPPDPCDIDWTVYWYTMGPCEDCWLKGTAQSGDWDIFDDSPPVPIDTYAEPACWCDIGGPPGYREEYDDVSIVRRNEESCQYMTTAEIWGFGGKCYECSLDCY